MPGVVEVPTSRRLALSIAEAAAQLGVHRLTLRAAIDRGQVHAIRVGRRWLIPRAAIDRLLAGEDPTAAGP